MPDSLPPPIFIDTPEALERWAGRMAQEPRLAVDTESNSLHAYQERVCLLQFSFPGADLLVDPIALPDLSPLAPLFADPAIEKVFHAAEYDVMTLKRDFGFTFANLFDTHLACRAVGRRESGLSKLLLSEFGVRLDKRHQRADWGRRPLPPELLDYARLDTHYLLELRDRLAAELEARSRLESFRELCDWLTTLPPSAPGFDPEGFWRLANGQRLNPQQVAVLRELYLFRDREARRRDRPPFKVLSDRTLVAIAQALPRDPEALAQLPGMTKGQMRRYGRGLLQAVARGLQATPPRRRRGPRPDPLLLERYEALRQWRKGVARREGVESDIILPREVLWQIAREAPRTPEDLRRLMRPLEGRFRTYGSEILKIVASYAPTRQP